VCEDSALSLRDSAEQSGRPSRAATEDRRGNAFEGALVSAFNEVADLKAPNPLIVRVRRGIEFAMVEWRQETTDSNGSSECSLARKFVPDAAIDGRSPKVRKIITSEPTEAETKVCKKASVREQNSV
jgi:hypothetical protein